MNIKEIREKAMQWCSRREYCRMDMHSKALSWGCTPAEADELIDFLVEHRFLDDRRYAEAFVKDKLQFNRWGRVKTAYMLHAHGIDRSTVTDILSEIDEAEYSRILTAELQKKYRTLTGSMFERRAKLFRFAAGRGFEPDIINEAINRILGK